MNKLNVLVTGGNRGIGLEFVKQLASNNNIKRVFATSRDPNYSEIVDLQKQFDKDKIVIVGLNTTNEISVNNATRQVDSVLKDEGLDILINNAGVAEPYTTILEESGETMSRLFYNNVVGTHLITKSLIPSLKRSETKKIVGITTSFGTLTGADPKLVKEIPHMPSYYISKTALNMLFRQFSIALREDKFTILLISPGSVKSRMNPSGLMTPVKSVELQLKTILSSTIEDNGSFFNYNGKKLQW